MKARFFAIAALVLGMASCAKDFAPEANLGGEVDFTLAVSAPELGATRADGDEFAGHNSAYGAIDYLSDAEWKKVDLRYTLEVYDVADDYANAKPIKDRQVKFVDKYEGVTFETRLAPNRNYRFVVFADFVEEEKVNNDPAIEAQRTIGMRHDIGDNLTQITIKKDAINDEYADAYFGTLDFNPTNNVANKVEKPMVLTRPYAKMRVVATDLHELNLNVDPGYVKVIYNAYHPNAFNAVNGVISGKYEQKDYTYECNYTEKYGNISKLNLSNYLYTNGYEEKTTTNADGVVRHTHMTLFTDYILAEDTQKPIQFTMTVFEDEAMNNPIKETAFNTEIPVQRNHLTTIIGNVLTTATEVKVTIDDNFANADHQNWVFDAFVNGGEVTLDQNYTIGSTLYVESGVEAVLNLNGYSIKNNKENQLTDVIVVKEGGKLTINGNGTIEAVDGNDGYAVICEGKLIINGGTYKSGRDKNKASNAIIYARGKGEVYINDGIFNTPGSWNDGSFVLNKKDSDRDDTVIKVYGGKFNRFDPANNAAEGPNTNFCAENYGTILNGNYYEVVSMAIVHNAEEFTKAAENAEIKAMRFANDIIFNTGSTIATAYVTTNKVIYADGFKLVAGGNTKKQYGLSMRGDIKVTINDIVMENCGGMYINNGAKVVINNATMAPKYPSSGFNMFYVYGSELTVNSGEYRMNNTGIKYFASCGNSKIDIMGGTYHGTQSKNQVTVYEETGGVVKIYGGEYYVAANRAFDPTKWLADGYTTVATEADWVKVVKAE